MNLDCAPPGAPAALGLGALKTWGRFYQPVLASRYRHFQLAFRTRRLLDVLSSDPVLLSGSLPGGSCSWE